MSSPRKIPWRGERKAGWHLVPRFQRGLACDAYSPLARSRSRVQERDGPCTPFGDCSSRRPEGTQSLLENTGTTALNWSASRTKVWTEFAPTSLTSGTLQPGDTETVTIQLHVTNANFLGITPTTPHTDTITFTNTTNGVGTTTRNYELTIQASNAELTVTPATNAEVGKAIATVLGRPYYLPAPGFAFTLAFGEVGELVTRGQRVMPERLLEHGFEFQFPELEPALDDILSN